ncbi:protein of unknown function [Oenococcus oeni]|nr:hypothetical protein AX764_01615 [Oenococcus oeni]VDC14056.1 protein of unknown function [Oenococcus oeni]
MLFQAVSHFLIIAKKEVAESKLFISSKTSLIIMKGKKRKRDQSDKQIDNQTKKSYDDLYWLNSSNRL